MPRHGPNAASRADLADPLARTGYPQVGGSGSRPNAVSSGWPNAPQCAAGVPRSRPASVRRHFACAGAELRDVSRSWRAQSLSGQPVQRLWALCRTGRTAGTSRRSALARSTPRQHADRAGHGCLAIRLDGRRQSAVSNGRADSLSPAQAWLDRLSPPMRSDVPSPIHDQGELTARRPRFP